MSTPRERETKPLRRLHADVTRRAVLDAARSLFVAHGYAGTSMRRLAEQAGVAVQTIYSAFGSKPGVLMALLDALDVDAAEPIARRLAEGRDPAEVPALVAALERGVRELGGDVLRIVRDAAATDPEIVEVWDRAFDRHRDGVARVCDRLARAGHLRDGLTREGAYATALALTSLEVYEELVHRAGWSHDDYERWLASALRHSLLGSD